MATDVRQLLSLRKNLPLNHPDNCHIPGELFCNVKNISWPLLCLYFFLLLKWWRRCLTPNLLADIWPWKCSISRYGEAFSSLSHPHKNQNHLHHLPVMLFMSLGLEVSQPSALWMHPDRVLLIPLMRGTSAVNVLLLWLCFFKAPTVVFFPWTPCLLSCPRQVTKLLQKIKKRNVCVCLCACVCLCVCVFVCVLVHVGGWRGAEQRQWLKWTNSLIILSSFTLH